MTNAKTKHGDNQHWNQTVEKRRQDDRKKNDRRTASCDALKRDDDWNWKNDNLRCHYDTWRSIFCHAIATKKRMNRPLEES